MANAKSPATVRSYTSPREDVAGLVPQTAQTVLDLGCSDGSVGAFLKQRQDCIVTGVELDPDYAARASERLDRVIQGDVVDGLGQLAGDRFDCVICADILEHLAEPREALEIVTTMLESEGTVVVSIPNVRFFTTFVQLGLRGTWPQLERGVHDRTHLRWFTDADARRLFAAVGLRVADTLTHYRLGDQPGFRFNRYARVMAKGPLRGFLAYQMLYQLRADRTGRE